MILQTSTLVIAYCLAIMMAVAGVSKLFDRRRFRAVLYNYDILPGAVLGLASVVLPVLEIAIAIALVVPAAQVFGAMGATILLVLYGAMIGFNIMRGRRAMDCGCSFGRSSGELSGGLVWRNIVLAVLALGVVVASPLSVSLWAHINAVFGAVAVWFVYATLDIVLSSPIRFHRKGSHHHA